MEKPDNERRIALINKKYDGLLTLEEAEELGSLQAAMSYWLNYEHPLPGSKGWEQIEIRNDLAKERIRSASMAQRTIIFMYFYRFCFVVLILSMAVAYLVDSHNVRLMEASAADFFLGLVATNIILKPWRFIDDEKEQRSIRQSPQQETSTGENGSPNHSCSPSEEGAREGNPTPSRSD